MSVSMQVQLELAKHTKLELATMLAAIIDGQDASDIRAMTGLPMSRCETIIEVGRGITQALWN